MELQECGLLPALLGLLPLLLVVHCQPPVSHRPSRGHSGLGLHEYTGKNTSLYRVCRMAQKDFSIREMDILSNQLEKLLPQLEHFGKVASSIRKHFVLPEQPA
jgi:hypothetical protein